jgi:mannose/fructose/N-acetylgalactosamine-specific phosphotransferase system component IIC
MKAWVVASLAAAGGFAFGVVIALEVLVYLRMPKSPPGASIGWDPVSFVQSSGLQVLVICVGIAGVTFAIVYAYLSRHPLPRN